MTPISIAEIIDIIGADVIQESEDDICISKIETDSRHILFPEKTIFFALDGQYTQGHHFIPTLSKKGVRVFVTHADAIQKVSGYVLKVKNTVHALQILAIHYRRKFSIPVIGITGSNGKTIVK
jgi:alanine racemase